MLTESFRGVMPVAPTPFADDGRLDLGAIDRLIEFYLDCRVDGLTVLGFMGEATKLTLEESLEVVRRFLASVGGRLPVVVGTGALAGEALRRLAGESMDAGAAGLMVAPSAGARTDEAVLQNLVWLVGHCGSAPIVLQDYPPSNGIYLSVPLILRIVAELRQIVMFKHEDTPGLQKLSRLRRESAASGLRRVSVMAGNGGMHLVELLSRGADGASTGFSYPEMLVEVAACVASGELEAASDAYDAYLPLLLHEYQQAYGLAVRKYVLFRRGVLASPAVRSPGVVLTDADRQETDRLLRRLERRIAGRPQRRAAAAIR